MIKLLVFCSFIGFEWSTEESDLKSFQHGVERGWFGVIAMSNNVIIVESVLYELYTFQVLGF